MTLSSRVGPGESLLRGQALAQLLLYRALEGIGVLLPHLFESRFESIAPRERAVLIEAFLNVRASLVQPELAHELVGDLLRELLGRDQVVYRLSYPLGTQVAILLLGQPL